MAKPEIREPAFVDWWDESDEWSEVISDNGYAIELKGSDEKPDVFIGKFLSSAERDFTDEDTGETRKIIQMIFEDRIGKRCNTFANYALTEAIAKGLKPGDVVRISHFGKRDIGGGRTVNRVSVDVKKQ